jgi:hypothetical protein
MPLRTAQVTTSYYRTKVANLLPRSGNQVRARILVIATRILKASEAIRGIEFALELRIPTVTLFEGGFLGVERANLCRVRAERWMRLAVFLVLVHSTMTCEHC